eukprot:gnl/TRDRNA2_/TRDRNA2_155458_c0_seq1.p1 gnl/TRDRNA2_/TRDRNA2_155458_c0~~gnl/TRDRNA2_/TRDRNA2_155458_c0_seq1.p1  ORF type:complete len:747 (-),score=180.58 gnl/TRDRNA2_/TRDRNA2_155458_c0_seq1:45-2213(-)
MAPAPFSTIPPPLPLSLSTPELGNAASPFAPRTAPTFPTPPTLERLPNPEFPPPPELVQPAPLAPVALPPVPKGALQMPQSEALRATIAERFVGAYQAQLDSLRRATLDEQTHLESEAARLRQVAYEAQRTAAQHQAQVRALQGTHLVRSSTGLELKKQIQAVTLMIGSRQAELASVKAAGKKEQMEAERIESDLKKQMDELRARVQAMKQRRVEEENHILQLQAELYKAREDRDKEEEAMLAHDQRAKDAEVEKIEEEAAAAMKAELAARALKEAVAKVENDLARERAAQQEHDRRNSKRLQELEFMVDRMNSPEKDRQQDPDSADAAGFHPTVLPSSQQTPSVSTIIPGDTSPMAGRASINVGGSRASVSIGDNSPAAGAAIRAAKEALAGHGGSAAAAALEKLTKEVGHHHKHHNHRHSISHTGTEDSRHSSQIGGQRHTVANLSTEHLQQHDKQMLSGGSGKDAQSHTVASLGTIVEDSQPDQKDADRDDKKEPETGHELRQSIAYGNLPGAESGAPQDKEDKPAIPRHASLPNFGRSEPSPQPSSSSVESLQLQEIRRVFERCDKEAGGSGRVKGEDLVRALENDALITAFFASDRKLKRKSGAKYQGTLADRMYQELGPNSKEELFSWVGFSESFKRAFLEPDDEPNELPQFLLKAAQPKASLPEGPDRRATVGVARTKMQEEAGEGSKKAGLSKALLAAAKMQKLSGARSVSVSH